MIKAFFKDSALYIGVGLISKTASLLVVPIYTRLLSPSDYGMYDMLTIIINLANIIVTLEITQGVARFCTDSTSKPDVEQYTSSAFWFTIGVNLILFAVCLAKAPIFSRLIFHGSQYETIIKLTCYVFISNGIFYFVQNQLRWMLMVKHYAFVSLLYTFLSIGLSILTILWVRLGVQGLILSQLIAGFIASAVGIIPMRKLYILKFNAPRLFQLLQFSAPLVPSSAIAIAALYTDRIMLNNLMSLNEVGLLGVAYRFASIGSILLIGFQGSLTPLITANYKNPETAGHLESIFRYFLFLAAAYCVAIALFSPELIGLFTSPRYHEASALIPLLSASFLLMNMYIFMPGLWLAKKTHILTLINITSLLTNLILNYLLIPIFGVIGAALSTFLSYFAVFSLQAMLSQKYYFVPHEWKKHITVGAILTGLILATSFSSYFHILPAHINEGALVLFKLTIISSFMFLLYRMKYIENSIIQWLKSTIINSIH